MVATKQFLIATIGIFMMSTAQLYSQTLMKGDVVDRWVYGGHRGIASATVENKSGSTFRISCDLTNTYIFFQRGGKYLDKGDKIQITIGNKNYIFDMEEYGETAKIPYRENQYLISMSKDLTKSKNAHFTTKVLSSGAIDLFSLKGVSKELTTEANLTIAQDCGEWMFTGEKSPNRKRMKVQ